MIVFAISFYSLSARCQADYGAVLIGTKLGTTGFGLVAGIDFSKRVSMRGQVSYAEVKDVLPIFGEDISIDWKLSNQAVILDFHPFVNSFRLSAGVFSNRNELSNRARGEELTFNETEYNAEIDVELAFRPLTPYVGFGFNSGRGRTGYGFNLEVGILAQGTPQVQAFGQVHASGSDSDTRCRFHIEDGVVSTDVSPVCRRLFPALEDDLAVETSDLEELEGPTNLDFYPVVEIGISYRF